MKKFDLRAMIKQLADVERTCFRKRSRFAFYRYLEAVYECYGRLRRTKKAKTTAKVLISLFDLAVKPDAHPIRVLIEASSSADNKTKSRWTQALRYVWHERKKGRGCLEMLRLNGGPAGCADKFAALTPRTPRGYLAFGSPHLPRIPLYIHEDCLN